jgi:HlyD family secretion protein
MRRSWWVLLAIAIVIAVAAYWWFTRPPAPLTPARSAQVVREDVVNTVSASGTIAPQTQWLLAFEAPGTIAEVNVTAGDRVSEGQVLAALDTVDLARAVSQAQQAVTVQTLTIARLKAPPGEAELAAAQAAVIVARANLSQTLRGPDRLTLQQAANDETLAWNAYLQADTQRNAVLDNPFTPGDERAPFDAAAGMAAVNYQITRYQRALAGKGPNAAAVAAARVQLAQAQANLDRLQAGAGTLDLRATELQLALAQGQQARAQLALDHARLTAPHAGVIAVVNARVGERAPGDKPAVVLVDDSVFHLDVAVDEIDVAQLVVGQPVTMTLDALPGESFPGKITRIATLAATAGGVVSYAVRVDFDKLDQRVRAGMTANATIVTERHTNVLVVPNWAVRIDRETGQATVPVRHGDQVVETPVTLGLRNESVSEVLSGVNEGDQLVLLSDRQQLSLFGGGQ